MKNKKVITILLIILNAIVLLGQIWPSGAPPFARWVNMITLVLNILFLLKIRYPTGDSQQG